MNKDTLESRYQQILNKDILQESFSAQIGGKNAAQSIKDLIKRGSMKPYAKDIYKFIDTIVNHYNLSGGDAIDFRYSVFDNLKKLGIKIKDAPIIQKKYSSSSNTDSSVSNPTVNNDNIHDTNIQSMYGL